MHTTRYKCRTTEAQPFRRTTRVCTIRSSLWQLPVHLQTIHCLQITHKKHEFIYYASTKKDHAPRVPSMQKRAMVEAKRSALLSTIQASNDLKAQADGEQRADNLKRRNTAAAQAAEMLFQKQYESRIEFDRRKKRDEDQQAALAGVISKRKREQSTWKIKLRSCVKATRNCANYNRN